MSLMLVWSCSLVALALWLQITFSESMDLPESQPLLSHQVAGVNLFEVSILHPTIFLQPLLLSQRGPGWIKTPSHKLLSKQGRVQVSPPWRQSCSLALILLAPLWSALGQKKSSSIPSTKSTTQNSHDAHFPCFTPSFTFLNLRKERTGWSYVISEVLAYYFSLSTEKGPGVGSFLAVLAL